MLKTFNAVLGNSLESIFSRFLKLDPVDHQEPSRNCLLPRKMLKLDSQKEKRAFSAELNVQDKYPKNEIQHP